MEELLQVMAGAAMLVIVIALFRGEFKRRKGGVIK